MITVGQGGEWCWLSPFKTFDFPNIYRFFINFQSKCNHIFSSKILLFSKCSSCVNISSGNASNDVTVAEGLIGEITASSSLDLKYNIHEMAHYTGVSKWAGTRYFYPPEIVYSTGRNYWTPPKLAVIKTKSTMVDRLVEYFS